MKTKTETIKKILEILHNPKTGFDSLRTELGQEAQNQEQYDAAKEKVLNKMAARHSISMDASYEEKIFVLTGQDIVDNRICFSCGNAAKAFCYINSKLHELDSEYEPLPDVKIMTSIDINHLIDGMSGHTLPCVKMDDGEYYAIEPKAPEIDMPILTDKVIVGGNIHHILPKLKGKEFRIMAILDPDDPVLYDFNKFLNLSVLRNEQVTTYCDNIENILQTQPSFYTFCVMAAEKNLPITVIYTSAGYTILSIKLDDQIYYFNHSVPHLQLHKTNDADRKTHQVVWQKTPAEYVKWLNENHNVPNKGTERV